MKKYSIHSQGESAEILIYEPIGVGFFDGINAKQFNEEVSALKASDITVRINSPGGDVFEGVAMYNTLKRHKAHVTVQVDGLAASIASVLAMAGDIINIAESAMMMVHNPWTITFGEASEHRKTADLLDQVKGNIAGIYSGRSGLTVEAVNVLMDDETWMTAADAEDFGFADSVTEPLKIAACAFDPEVFGFDLPEQIPHHVPQDRRKWQRVAAARRATAARHRHAMEILGTLD